MMSSSGIKRGSASLGFGCGARIASSQTRAGVFAPEGGLAAPRLHQETATAKMSVAGPSLRPGDLLRRHVPRRAEDLVPRDLDGAAMPKSMTFTCPSSSIITFRGVMSRCTTSIRRCA